MTGSRQTKKSISSQRTRRVQRQIDRTPFSSAPSAMRSSSPRSGVVLLEVVLAMSLFFAAAMVILAGMNASLRGIQRVQLEARAQDLAVTALSEVQMGLVPLTSDGPTQYEDAALTGWTRQIVVEPYEERQLGLELPAFHRVEVAIRYEPTGYSTSLTILLPDEQPAAAGLGSTTPSPTGPGAAVPSVPGGGGSGRGTGS